MGVRLATWLYGRAARLLPREFRTSFGAELVECFERIAADARRSRGRLAVAGVTARSIVDLLTRAPRQHLAAARSGALGAGGGWVAGWQDVRHAARRLRRRPAFAAASVLTLGLGVAAATSVFSLVHGVVLSPLPYPEGDRLVVVDHGGTGLGIDAGLGVTYGFFRFYRERTHDAVAMAMYTSRDETLTGAGEPVRLRVAAATPDLERVLGVRPLVGRWFTAAEGEPGAAPTAVLSHGLWRDRFGGDVGIVGRTIRLEGSAVEVVGVMPAGFGFPDDETALWTPLMVPSTGVGGWNRLAVARLRDGATAASLQTELAGLLPILRETTDDPARVSGYLDDAGITPRIVTLKESMVADVQGTLWILLGTVGLVLLIAVANVANLFLVRAEEGQRETAVRTALGASRGRVTRGFLAETLLIAGAAGAVGIGTASVAVTALRSRAPVSVPRLGEVTLDPAVLAVAVGTCLVAAVLLGLIPSLRRAGDLSVALKEGAKRTTAGRARLRGRNVLVATQVALALVLLIGSGLLFRTFRQLREIDPGFSTRQALTFEVGLPETRYGDRAAVRGFHERFLDRLRGIPGVEGAAGVAACLPLTPNMCWGETLEAEGHPTPEGQVPPVTGARVATTDYFHTLGIPLRGRAFTASDETGPAVPVILSEAAATAYFEDDDALGRRVRFGEDDPWHTVVGIAGDVRGRMEAADGLMRVIYLPLRGEAQIGPPPSPMAYVVRSGVPPTSIVGAVRAAIAEIDPLVPLADVETLQGRIDRATAPTAFALTLIGLAAVIALVLGVVGVYGVVAYAVSRRTAEIGVRMALGAAAGDVRRMVLRQGGGVVLAGVAAGLAGAFALTRLMAGMLHGVSPTDPLSYALLTALMLAVAALALYLPARRASRVDPVEALRSE